MMRYRTLIFTLITVIYSTSLYAQGSTYILQVSSNLKCDRLAIELISKADDTAQYLKFTSSAFAAANLTKGRYDFGQVICSNEDGRETFDMLVGKLASLEISDDKAYYGGRLIFKELDDVDQSETPEVLSNCTHLISKARGEKSDDCRDGVGVDTKAKSSRQISVYAPEVTEADLKTVRDALSVSEDQLIYLSLRN